ncbi:MAG: hemin uptake protein HemP [Candidatus Thiodiazotropha sp.]
MTLAKPGRPQGPRKQDTSCEIPRLNSAELFRGQNRLVIMHQGGEYLLQITRQGKLILTK